MGLPRIIPTLLVKNNYFYKGEKFKNHKYIGDPINIIKIFGRPFGRPYYKIFEFDFK